MSKHKSEDYKISAHLYKDCFGQSKISHTSSKLTSLLR